MIWEEHGTVEACDILGVSRATLYRMMKSETATQPDISGRLFELWKASRGQLDLAAACVALWGEDTKVTRNRLHVALNRLRRLGKIW